MEIINKEDKSEANYINVKRSEMKISILESKEKKHDAKKERTDIAYKRLGYKKKVLDIFKLMQGFERKDNQYINNLRTNIDRAYSAIRRTDSVVDKKQNDFSHFKLMQPKTFEIRKNRSVSDLKK